jgi:hypothetical protein
MLSEIETCLVYRVSRYNSILRRQCTSLAGLKAALVQIRGGMASLTFNPVLRVPACRHTSTTLEPHSLAHFSQCSQPNLHEHVAVSVLVSSVIGPSC